MRRCMGVEAANAKTVDLAPPFLPWLHMPHGSLPAFSPRSARPQHAVGTTGDAQEMKCAPTPHGAAAAPQWGLAVVTSSTQRYTLNPEPRVIFGERSGANTRKGS